MKAFQLKRTRPTTRCKLIMSTVGKFLPLDKVSGEEVGRNLHQSGGGKIQVKISRQIPRVEAEPVIHHAGHTPLKYKEVIFRRVLTYTCYAMIWYELFQRNREWSHWSGKNSGSLVSTLSFSKNRFPKDFPKVAKMVTFRTFANGFIWRQNCQKWPNFKQQIEVGC